MKKTLSISLLISILFFGCKSAKNDPTPIKPPDNPIVDTYFPLTAGSNFSYDVTNRSGSKAVFNVTMTADTAIINSDIYTVSNYMEYYILKDHICKWRELAKTGTIAMEYQLLNDTASVGYTWISNYNETGTFGGVNFPMRFRNKIVEKGITRIVKGKTYTDVTHTLVMPQNYVNGNFVDSPNSVSVDFYVAKNVGIIEFNKYTNVVELLQTNLLTSYSIK